MSRTRKFYEESLKQVRIMYKRSRSQIDRDLLQMELRAKALRERQPTGNSQFLGAWEREFIEIMETSRLAPNDSRADLDRTDKYASAIAKTIPQSEMLKTTPRSARPQVDGPESKRKTVLVPKLPIGSRVTPPMKPSSSKVQINSSTQKQHDQNVSDSINESQILPPPLLLND